MTLRFAPLVATLLIACARLDAAGADDLPQLNAKTTRVTLETTYFSDGVRLAHGDIVIYADTIELDNRERVAVARGNVLLLRGPQRLIAEEVTYRSKDRTFSVGAFRVGEGRVFASGASAEGQADDLMVRDVRATYGEPDPLSPFIQADRLHYTRVATDATEEKRSRVKVEHGRLGVGQAAILPLPSFSESPDQPTVAGVDARAGYSGNLGAELGLAAKMAVAPAVRVGGDIGVFTKRGVLAGPVGDYDTFGADGLGAKGAFRTGYIQDQGDAGLDVRGDAIGADRGYVEWSHHQMIAPDLRIGGQLNYWSDSYVTRDFRSEGYYRIQTPDTWLEAEKLGDNHVVSLFTRTQVNDYSLVKERLPELRFDGLPVEVGAGVYHRINASVAALREDDPLKAANPADPGSIRSERADLYYGAMRPFSPREWLAFTPVVGARVTHYNRTPAGSSRNDYTRVLGEVGFDAKLFESSGVWAAKSERWQIDGLRHISTPTLAYRRSPSADVGAGSIPAIDDDPFNTYLRPLGLADRRDIDTLPALDTFRLGWRNVLQTRDRVYGSRNLVELDLAADQHASAESAADQGTSRDRTYAHAFFALNPARWLRFDVYNRTGIQTGRTEELNTGLTLRDADVWSLRLATHYLEDAVAARMIQEYTASLGVRLSEIYSVLARVRFDSRSGDMTEQSLAMSQRLSRFWTLQYEISAHDGPRREDDFGFSVSVETQGF